ncbi:hypothetical protein RGQ29_005378 [Quercus rubra]|uniref:Uncharacterized protein n=1 Tax=Quercus rubra TaxID=3512 RepID=A0AAN7E4E9_QUERU|nr:hypothetical protein RGQ29_005378 [Quercus rubra]
MSLRLIFDESSVEYGGNMPLLDTFRILDGGVRKLDISYDEFIWTTNEFEPKHEAIVKEFY